MRIHLLFGLTAMLAFNGCAPTNSPAPKDRDSVTVDPPRETDKQTEAEHGANDRLPGEELPGGGLRERAGARPNARGFPVTAVSLSPDGKRGLAVTGDTLTLWSLPDGTIKRKYESHPDGPLAGNDYEEIRAYQGRVVNALVVDWKLGIAVTGDGEATIRVWEIVTGKLLQQFKAVDYDPKRSYGGSCALVLSESGKDLYTSGRELEAKAAVKLWDVRAGKLIKTLAHVDMGPSGMPCQIIVLQHEQRAILLGWTKILMLWDLGKDELIWKRMLPESSILAARPDGNRILVSSADRRLVTCDSKGEEINILQREMRKGECQQSSIAFIPPDYARVLTGGLDGSLTLWDVEKGKRLSTWGRGQAEQDDLVGAISFSGDGKLALTGGGGRTLQLWNVEDGKLIRALTAGPTTY